MRERLDLVRQDGARSLFYPKPWFKLVVASETILLSVLTLGAAVIASVGPTLAGRLFGVASFLLFGAGLLYFRRLRGPVLVLDEEGVQEPRRKAKPYVALWTEITGLEIKTVGKVRFLSIGVTDEERVLTRAGGSALMRWAYRRNQRYGLSVAALRAWPLPITLERLAEMMRERLG